VLALRDELDRLDALIRNRTIRNRAAVDLCQNDPGRMRAARRLNGATGVLAASVLLDSAVEHYRGSFANPAMILPLIVSSMTIGVSAHGFIDKRPGAHRIRGLTYGAAMVTGLFGAGFHVYNLLKRPGALSLQNLFYGAPLGAPMALLLAGLLGSAAERTRNDPAIRGRIGRRIGRRIGMGRLVGLVSGLGLLGTSAEAGLLHFRGAFHNPAMFAPVTIPPVGGALLLNSLRGRGGWMSRLWLRLTAALGLAGIGFHAWGVHRNMGGWRNWRQNLLNGPPVPAPPSFLGLSLAGIAALDLLDLRCDE
jgi:hypothetical protein